MKADVFNELSPEMQKFEKQKCEANCLYFYNNYYKKKNDPELTEHSEVDFGGSVEDWFERHNSRNRFGSNYQTYSSSEGYEAFQEIVRNRITEELGEYNDGTTRSNGASGGFGVALYQASLERERQDMIRAVGVPSAYDEARPMLEGVQRGVIPALGLSDIDLQNFSERWREMNRYPAPMIIGTGGEVQETAEDYRYLWENVGTSIHIADPPTPMPVMSPNETESLVERLRPLQDDYNRVSIEIQEQLAEANRATITNRARRRGRTWGSTMSAFNLFKRNDNE